MNTYRTYLFLLIAFLCGQSVLPQTWVSIDGTDEGESVTFEELASNDSIYQVKVYIHGYYDETIEVNNTTYHKITLSGCPTQDEIGKPALPLITQRVAIPLGADYSATVTGFSTQLAPSGNIYPAQKPLLETQDEEEFSIDSLTYSSSSYIPTRIRRGDIEIYRGMRNAEISVCPISIYYNGFQAMRIMRYFTLTVKFTYPTDYLARKRQAPQRRALSSMDNSEYDFSDIDMFCNGSAIPSFDNVETDAPYINDLYDYLIIVGELPSIRNSQALKDFVTDKTRKGHHCKVVNMSSIGVTCNEIKDYIKAEYNKGGVGALRRRGSLTYVLFIGDNNKIPLYSKKAIYQPNSTTRYLKSDYWYGCMDGDNDYQADVFVGRFSTNNLTYFKNMVQKSLSYENKLNPDYKFITLVSNFGYKYRNCMNSIAAGEYDHPLTFIKLYGATQQNGGTEATNDNILSEINAGVNIVNFRGHGSSSCWSNWNYLGQSFCGSQEHYLNNTIYPIFLSIACQTGDVSVSHCMLERFMESTHGASLFLGATENTYTDENNSYNITLYKELLNNGITEIGRLNTLAHIKTFPLYHLGTAIDNAFCYLIGGDPSLDIWTAYGKTFKDISFSREGDNLKISTGVTSNYRIVVTSEDGEIISSGSTSMPTYTLYDITDNCYVTLNSHDYVPLTYHVYVNGDYIQNKVFDENAIFLHTPIEIGYDVTNEEPEGSVFIDKGKTVIINNTAGVKVKNSFYVPKGAKLQIK